MFQPKWPTGGALTSNDHIMRATSARAARAMVFNGQHRDVVMFGREVTACRGEVSQHGLSPKAATSAAMREMLIALSTPAPQR